MIDTMVECATTCRRLTRVFQYKDSFYPCSHKFESYLPCQKLLVDLLQNIFSLIKTDRVEFQSKVWHWRNRTEKHQNFKNHIEWYVVINWNLCSCQLNKLATCYLLPATVASVSQRCYMLGEYQAANYHEVLYVESKQDAEEYIATRWRISTRMKSMKVNGSVSLKAVIPLETSPDGSHTKNSNPRQRRSVTGSSKTVIT